MTGETTLTIIGNLTDAPELRVTQSSIPVASFTIASTPRTFDRAANEWKDGETLFLRCSAWRELAEHIASSLVKGSRVIATGRLTQRSYQDREGNQRTSIELQIDEIGPSLRYATAQVVRAAGARGDGGRDAAGGSWAVDAYPRQDAAQRAGAVAAASGGSAGDADMPF